MSTATQTEALCLTPVMRHVLWWVFLIYVLFLFSRHTIFLSSKSPAIQCVQPPFELANLFLGGKPDEKRIEVWLEDETGTSKQLDLDEFFHYRLPHRSYISVPERCETLLRKQNTDAHQRLADFMRNSYMAKHPNQEFGKCNVYAVIWDLRTSDGSTDTTRELLATSPGQDR